MKKFFLINSILWSKGIETSFQGTVLLATALGVFIFVIPFVDWLSADLRVFAPIWGVIVYILLLVLFYRANKKIIDRFVLSQKKK